MGSMQIILVIFMVATLALVVVGVIAMAVNGKLNKNHSNKLMRLRVLFQNCCAYICNNHLVS